MIERQKKFKIGEKQFIAKFPNVGQMIDMESLKQALTSGRYGDMARSGIISMFNALDLVDTIAFYQICVPEVAQHYDIKNYTTIEYQQANMLSEAYKNEIRPWYDSVVNELKGVALNDNSTES